MQGVAYLRCALVFALVSACGGSAPPAESPAEKSNDTGAAAESSSDADTKPAPGEKSDSGEAPAGAASNTLDSPKAGEPKSGKSDVPAPNFKENGSVLEAINAVPQGTPRLNVEQEALGRPLNNPELYEPCKPGTAHFKAKVAIWDGKAVGLDLTTTPKNPKFASCVAERIRSITWPDKVKSLNIVEYTF